jgi:FKBP-type peptidyl-prolyl cis-trans isomerase FkpA
MLKVAALVSSVLLVIGVFALEAANAQQSPSASPSPKPSPHSSKTETETKAKAGKSTKGTKAASKSGGKTSETSLPKEVRKLVIQDTINGQGKVASKGKLIKVNYTGWLYDPSQAMGRGKQFDTSVGREPFQFRLGDGKVIRGWDEGFENMKVGGKRKLIIPSEMGYGDKGAGVEIPPNSTLMFEVELVDVM